MIRSRHREGELRLEVGGCSNTAKTRRESATSNWEYRSLAVDRVDEPVQPLTGVHVDGVARDVQDVVRRQLGSCRRTPSKTSAGSSACPVEGDVAESNGPPSR